MNNATDISMKFTNSVTGQGKIDKYIERLSSLKKVMESMPKTLTLSTDVSKELNTINKLLVNLNKNVSSFKKEMISALGSIKRTDKDANDLGKKLDLAFDYVKVRRFIAGLQTVSRITSELTNKSADYLENINLFEVAYGDTYEQAEKLVNKLTEMYGLDESQLTNMVGIFRQLANAMGLAVETSDRLAELLSYMSIDISSLYNLDLEKSSSVLQSALAGQTKPIRGATGGDITLPTLQTTLNSLGIERYASDLSYAEKRLVIIISLTRQLKKATNDFGKTIESPANQMRILNEQWERLSRAVGNVMLVFYEQALPVLNGIVMALTEIVNYIAILFGYDPEKYDFLGGVSDSVLDLEEGLEGASESAKKLKQGLRGFDKLNVITTPSSPSAGGAGGLDPEILDAFNDAYNEYLSKITDAEMKATKIRDRMMEWLGFTKQIDEETGDVSFTLEKLTGGSVLGALGIGGTIYSGIFIISKILTKIGITSKALPSLFAVLKTIIVAIAGALGISVGWVIAIGVALAGLVALMVVYWDEIKVLVSDLWNSISTFFVDLWNNINENFITPLINFISTLAQFIYDNVIKPVIDFFAPIVEAIVNIFALITEKVVEIGIGIGKAIYSILAKITEIFLKIVEIFVALGKAFYDYIIVPVFNFFKDVAVWAYDHFLKPFINAVVDVARFIYDNLIIPLWNGFVWLKDEAVKLFTKVGTVVVEFVSGLFRSIINGILWGIEFSINKFIGMLNGAIDIINKIPAVNISKVDYLSIPRLKTGMEFVPHDYYPAYLDYGERVLTKEENREYMNNQAGNLNQKNNQSPINATFIVQVGDEEVARKVINNLQDMAKSSGKPIKIG